MRRAFVILGWMLASALFLFILLQTVAGLYVRTQMTGTDPAAMLQQARDFAAAHADTLQELDLASVCLGLVLGLTLGMSGRLPGTRRRSAGKP